MTANASRGCCAPATRPSLEGAIVGVAPHSLRAVAPPDLDQVAQLQAEGPVHIHIAEQLREVNDCIAWSGRRPVEWLLDHAAVDSRWCLVHATHLTQAETRDPPSPARWPDCAR